MVRQLIGSSTGDIPGVDSGYSSLNPSPATGRKMRLLNTLTDANSKIAIPVLLSAGTYFVTSMVYLGLFWTFSNTALTPNRTYIVW